MGLVYSRLSPIKRKIRRIPFVYGYDIETCNNNQDYVLGCLYGNEKKFFYSKKQFIKEVSKNKYAGCYIACTNLGFDFLGTFHGEKEELQFNTLFRGSSLILAETYIINNKFSKIPPKTGKRQKLYFIDTMNYAPMSVEKMGKILGVPKIDKPIFLGERPKNSEDWDLMRHYNARDSKISKEFIDFLFNGFVKLGAEPKKTIASTGMDLFKRKYLNDVYYTHTSDILVEQFLGYYGAMVQAFKRGLIEDYNYYDYNSLYPDVMRNEYPDPNSLRVTFKNTNFYINTYHGMSKVEIYCPDIDKPLLPYRHDKKLLFPTGTFTGYYTHIELREAHKLGYVIKKVYKTFYYKKCCKPFKDYVTDLYCLRKKYKDNNDNMEIVVKLLMNSLYGKFGQKFENRDNWISAPTMEQLNKCNFVERFGEYFRIKQTSRPSAFCIPIWASYITAYARIKLYDIIKHDDVVYCDTDSVITKKSYKSSKELGKLKLELRVMNGYIVRPKFYSLIGYNDERIVKIKGLGKKIHIYEFKDIMINGKAKYKKFVKFKEHMRRNIPLNGIMDIEKNFSTEDNKREWLSDFSIMSMQSSVPLCITKEKSLKI